MERVRKKQDLPHSFMIGEMPIVTSSPIEGKPLKNSAFTTRPNVEENMPTWSVLLNARQQNTRSQNCTRKIEPMKERHSCDEAKNFQYQEESSFEPVAEHCVRVCVTPNRKIKIISSSARKLNRANPRCTNSSSNKNNPESEVSEQLRNIRHQLQNNQILTLEDLDACEGILKSHIAPCNLKGSKVKLAGQTPEFMNFIQKQLGQLQLSPCSSHMVNEKFKVQDRRLVSLAITKRKTSAEIQKRITQQEKLVKQQIKDIEQFEMKQIKATDVRKSALARSTMFSKIHSAHHKQVVSEKRKQKQINELRTKIRSEQSKNTQQNNTITKTLCDQLVREQYQELRNTVQQQRKEQMDVVKKSLDKLAKLKSSYEEKINEMKKVTSSKATEAGMEKKEIEIEIRKMERNMQQQFQTEYRSFLSKIGTLGDKKRLIRKEKADLLTERLIKADYVFEL